MADRIKSFEEFWPYYLSEHRDARSRRLHFMGTSGFLASVAASAVTNPLKFPLAMAGFAAIMKHGIEAEAEGRPLGHVAAMIGLGTAGAPLTFLPGVAFAYSCAWVGHFLVEHNRPATFEYPLWSLTADFVMWSHMVRGRLWTGDPLEALGLEDPVDLQPVPASAVAAAATGV